jgi:SAM-dependent methyltransferase
VVVGVVRGWRRIPRPVPLTDPQHFSDHFSSIAKRYAAYRPRYPQALADALATLTGRHDLAWDAGCGNGQLSVLLAERFARVIATEPSQAQLDEATAHPRVEYRRAKAEDPVLDEASVDLAVAAQAAHWFDWPRYVAEVARVTRPGGLVALVSYGILHVDPAGRSESVPLHSGSDADALVAAYYHGDVGPFWPPGREHVENGYRDLAWPWDSVAAPAITMTADWTRDELLGYVATWSATVKMIEMRGAGAYERLGKELARVWPDGERRTVTWPLAIRLARR